MVYQVLIQAGLEITDNTQEIQVMLSTQRLHWSVEFGQSAEVIFRFGLVTLAGQILTPNTSFKSGETSNTHVCQGHELYQNRVLFKHQKRARFSQAQTGSDGKMQPKHHW